MQSIDEMIVNKNMKSKLSEANIDPYSSEGRSEIYCRFVLENPKDLVSNKIGMIVFFCIYRAIYM